MWCRDQNRGSWDSYQIDHGTRKDVNTEDLGYRGSHQGWHFCGGEELTLDNFQKRTLLNQCHSLHRCRKEARPCTFTLQIDTYGMEFTIYIIWGALDDSKINERGFEAMVQLGSKKDEKDMQGSPFVYTTGSK